METQSFQDLLCDVSHISCPVCQSQVLKNVFRKRCSVPFERGKFLPKAIVAATKL